MMYIQVLFDDTKCSQAIRDMRRPHSVTYPRCPSTSVIKKGRDDNETYRQPHECQDCRHRFDDLTDTIFAGHHLPLRTWLVCL